jgi:hypothetical protein
MATELQKKEWDKEMSLTSRGRKGIGKRKGKVEQNRREIEEKKAQEEGK